MHCKTQCLQSYKYQYKVECEKNMVNRNAKDNETKMHLHLQKDDRHILNIKVTKIIAK